VSETFRGVVDGSAEPTELVPGINGLHQEHRCRGCCHARLGGRKETPVCTITCCPLTIPCVR
jgi:hypothetical protein